MAKSDGFKIKILSTIYYYYPADSIIQLLSNSALERGEQRSLMSGNPCDKYGETFHSLNGTGTLYGDAVLEQVTE